MIKVIIKTDSPEIKASQLQISEILKSALFEWKLQMYKNEKTVMICQALENAIITVEWN